MTRLSDAAALISGNPNDAQRNAFQAAPAWRDRHAHVPSEADMARALMRRFGCRRAAAAWLDGVQEAIAAECQRDKAQDARRAGL